MNDLSDIGMGRCPLTLKPCETFTFQDSWKYVMKKIQKESHGSSKTHRKKTSYECSTVQNPNRFAKKAFSEHCTYHFHHQYQLLPPTVLIIKNKFSYKAALVFFNSGCQSWTCTKIIRKSYWNTDFWPYH